VSILDKMAILSLVGADMRKMVGIAGRMFSTLGVNNVNIEMISQGMFSLLFPLSFYTILSLPSLVDGSYTNTAFKRGKRDQHLLRYRCT
jgi:predicted amino acid-binding ACT domain protein